MNKDQLARRLLTTFSAELADQVRAMNAELLALEAEPGNSERLKSLFRIAHTLKGAARACGVAPVERACHALETLLAEARDGARRLNQDDFTLLFATADALADAGKRIQEGQDLPATLFDSLRQ